MKKNKENFAQFCGDNIGQFGGGVAKKSYNPDSISAFENEMILVVYYSFFLFIFNKWQLISLLNNTVQKKNKHFVDFDL